MKKLYVYDDRKAKLYLKMAVKTEYDNEYE